MPAITLKGHSCTGHGCYLPRPSTEGAASFFVGGIPAHCQGHGWAVHGCSCGKCPKHGAVLAAGAPHFFIEGRAAGRIGDPVSCGGNVAQGRGDFIIGNGGGNSAAHLIALDEASKPRNATLFSGLKRRLEHTADLSDKDKLLLCLPAIAEAEAGRQTEWCEAQGWQYLSEFFHKWFTGPPSTDKAAQPPGFVEWEWLLEYERVRVAWDKLKRREYLLSKKAEEELAGILIRDGHVTDEKKEFNYIDVPPEELEPGYFQREDLGYDGDEDGLTAAMGAFSIHAVAAGYVGPIPGDEPQHKVVVERVALYVRDSFDFEDEYFVSQPLGAWDCETKRHTTPYGEWVDNKDFRSFRSRFAVGGDYHVYALPREIAELEETVYFL